MGKEKRIGIRVKDDREEEKTVEIELQVKEEELN